MLRGLLLVVLLLLRPGASHGAAEPSAEPRFGDTTWVAPSAAQFESGDPTQDGPRVAAPDVERTWEKVLRAPFRLVFYPVRLVARGSQYVVTVGSDLIGYEPRLVPWLGVKAAPVVGISGTSGPSAGVAIQGRSGLGSRASLIGTWSTKDTRRIRLRAGITEPGERIGVEVYGAYDYRPNRRFYGLGNESTLDGKTIYLRRENVGEASVFIGQNPHRRVRGMFSISDVNVGAGYRDAPRAQDVYSPDEVPFLEEESSVTSFGGAFDLGFLDDPLNPSMGVHFRGEARRFDSIDNSGVHYNSWYAESRAYVPVLAPRRVIALRYIYQGVDPRGDTEVPFYRMPVSGEQARFAAFRSNRFLDRQLMLGHAEYRWIVLPQYTVWAHVFGQLGAVAPDQQGFTLQSAHRSIGGGFRAVLSPSTTARLEIANGDEGTRVYLDLRGDF